jgi:hypothetical protein
MAVIASGRALVLCCLCVSIVLGIVSGLPQECQECLHDMPAAAGAAALPVYFRVLDDMRACV